jgi:hypothetical protein
MESVIPSITTPLALAALLLLVFGTILGSIFRTRGARRVVVWIFSSVIILSVMANIAYLVQIFLFSEALLTGNVRDSESNRIKFPYVDLQAVGRTATSDDGSFQVSIPYSRQRASYAIFSSAPGFSPYSSTLLGPRPEPRTITLQKLKATLDNSMQFGSDITLTQDIGIPILVTGAKIGDSIGRPHI